MLPAVPYSEAARAYVDAVRNLTAAPAQILEERSAAGPVSYTDLAERAERIVPLSEDLTRTAQAQLASPDMAVQVQASTTLLAKAVTDLEISAYLLQAAEDEEDMLTLDQEAVPERSAPAPRITESYLDLILGESEPRPLSAERGTPEKLDLLAARTMLIGGVDDTLDLILSRASKTGQAAIGGIFALGLGEVAKAVGIVGMDIATMLGQAEKVTRLYNLFRSFALQAYQSIIQLLGLQLAQTGAKQVLAWANRVQKGEEFAKLLDKLYETKQTGQALNKLVAGGSTEAEKILKTVEEVNVLGEAYRKQTELAEKMIPKLGFLAALPLVTFPQARTLLSATYLLLGAYVVLLGADFVDAQRLRLLNRVPGVRQVVEKNLAAA